MREEKAVDYGPISCMAKRRGKADTFPGMI